MADDRSFRDVMSQLRAGDEAAAGEVFQRFAQRLIALARSRLDSWIRQREDPEDVVQSVYKSFFVRYGEGQFQVVNWNDLWSLLTLITIRKCADRVDYARAQRRDASRQVSSTEADDGHRGAWQAVDPEPTPIEALVLTETVDGLLRSFDQEDQPIIQLSLQGYTTLEISAELHRAERTVRRVREYARKRLLAMQAR
jgi:RNA polymerase sigma-70 factor, ECF subfamily